MLWAAQWRFVSLNCNRGHTVHMNFLFHCCAPANCGGCLKWPRVSHQFTNKSKVHVDFIQVEVILGAVFCPLRSLLSITVWTGVLPCSVASSRLRNQVRWFSSHRAVNTSVLLVLKQERKDINNKCHNPVIVSTIFPFYIHLCHFVYWSLAKPSQIGGG